MPIEHNFIMFIGHTKLILWSLDISIKSKVHSCPKQYFVYIWQVIIGLSADCNVSLCGILKIGLRANLFLKYKVKCNYKN
jgi:hypothetical protein